jgi:hydroxymethylglutaryl-CoA lyase
MTGALLICDTGPRDGLQAVATPVSPRLRAELALSLADAGLPRVEAASFVHPTVVPQMAGAEEVASLLCGRDGTEFTGLALNAIGVERGLATSLDRLNIGVAATDSFSLRNAGASAGDALIDAVGAIRRAADAGRPVSATISVAFGCPYDGEVDSDQVVAIATAAIAAGADEVIAADTIGVASPARVRRLIEELRRALPTVRLGVHHHDTRGAGLANVYAAIDAGAEVLDVAVAGLGGCPFAPGATGNLATEDLVYALERDGVDTGIDVDRLLAIANWLERSFGTVTQSRVARAGAWPSAGRRAPDAPPVHVERTDATASPASALEALR